MAYRLCRISCPSVLRRNPSHVGDFAICGKMEQPMCAAAPPHLRPIFLCISCLYVAFLGYHKGQKKEL